MPAENIEVLVEPYEPWIAPVGTSFLACSATAEELEEGGWVRVGKQPSDLNMAEAGATVTMSQTTATFTPAGSPRPRKVWRTEHVWQCAFEIADMTPKTLGQLMNGAVPKNVGGKESVALAMPFTMEIYSLILRGPSPLHEGTLLTGAKAQFQVTSCYQTANPAPKFAAKGGPAFLAVQFTAVEAVAGKWVEYVAE